MQAGDDVLWRGKPAKVCSIVPCRIAGPDLYLLILRLRSGDVEIARRNDAAPI